MKIITIDDNKAGHKSQLQGVLSELLNIYSKDTIHINMSIPNYLMSFLPNKYYKLGLFFLPKNIKANLRASIKNMNGPCLIVAIGRRTFMSALYTKYILQKLGANPQLVYLMPPIKNHPEIDLCFYHSYKSIKQTNPKLIPIIAAPHNISKEAIATAKESFASIFKNLPKPINTVLIGGSAKNINFNKLAAKDLIKYLIEIKQKLGGSIVVISGRRSNINIETFLATELKSLDGIFFGYYYHKPQINPYLGALAYADNIIVSGESISMLSESCSLEKPNIFVFFSEHFYAKRYTLFHELLYKNHYAYPKEAIFKEEIFKNQPKKSVNITKEVAEHIKKILD